MAILTAAMGGLCVVAALVWTGGVKGILRDPKTGMASQHGTVAKIQFFWSTVFHAASGDSVVKGVDSLLGRMSSDVAYFGMVLNRVPRVLPHEGGALTLGVVEHVVLPRFLFPDKTNLGSDSDMTRKYTGLKVAGAESNTSIGIGYVGLFYVDLGIPLMFVPILVWGLVAGLCLQILIRSSPNVWVAYAVLIIFALDNLNWVLGNVGAGRIEVKPFGLILGISFFTFHAISYVVDVYKRNANAERRLPDFALYILLFPQLIAGPIIRWRDIAAQLGMHEQRTADVAYGVRRFVLGLGKKVLIANTLGRVADQIFALPAVDLTTPLAWLGLVCYTLQIYFDFSGYSDMAIGLMRMFGFRILENFNNPYIARSIREFWRRWHISLSNWFRDYLYIPLGGNRRGTLRGYANLVIVFLLCGLWHGASWPFVIWGIWHGLFLVAERAGLDRVLARVGPLRHVYAMAAVMGGWVLFRCDTLAHAGDYGAALMGLAQGDAAARPLAEFLNPLVTTAILLGVVGATPIARRLGEWRDAYTARGGATATLVASSDIVWLAVVGIAACAWLAAGTYNPFIYFRF
jgi:alginate O-acetyltransferase complex protein AlgI